MKTATRVYKGNWWQSNWKGLRLKLGYLILGKQWKWYIIGLSACEIYARDNQGNDRLVDKYLEEIFKIAHSCDVMHECFDSHSDWRDAAFDIFRSEYPAK